MEVRDLFGQKTLRQDQDVVLRKDQNKTGHETALMTILFCLTREARAPKRGNNQLNDIHPLLSTVQLHAERGKGEGNLCDNNQARRTQERC